MVMEEKSRGRGRGVLAFCHEWQEGKGRGRGGMLDTVRPPKTQPGGMGKDVTEESNKAKSIQNQSQSQTKNPTDSTAGEGVDVTSTNQYMVMCYTYKANKDNPGGFHELSAKKGEYLEYLCSHPDNEHWWKAKNEDGEIGYVPSSYVIMKEDQVLPWLEQATLEKSEKERKERLQRKQQQQALNQGKGFGPPPKELTSSPATSKPYVYVSAYNRSEQSSNSTSSSSRDQDNSSSRYYCDTCCKSFNGPKPYRAHMVSRSHREEVELRAEEDNN